MSTDDTVAGGDRTHASTRDRTCADAAKTGDHTSAGLGGDDFCLLGSVPETMDQPEQDYPAHCADQGGQGPGGPRSLGEGGSGADGAENGDTGQSVSETMSKPENSDDRRVEDHDQPYADQENQLVVGPKQTDGQVLQPGRSEVDEHPAHVDDR